jgi:hypothetical protein
MTSVVFLKYAWGLAEKAGTYKSPTESEKARAKKDEELQAAILEELRESISKMDFTSTSIAWQK